MTDINFVLKGKIKSSRLTIFDKLDSNHELYLAEKSLQMLLEDALLGISVAGLPIRTRSKKVKSLVCEGLGYPIPRSFRKTQPRFLSQNFDIYVQKSTNLQIWNEDVEPDRRYVIITLDSSDIIRKIIILLGNQLSKFDTTGKITKKFQARLTDFDKVENELFSEEDTEKFSNISTPADSLIFNHSPATAPKPRDLLPIREIYNRLQSIIGNSFVNPGATQERNRGVELQKLVCSALGYENFADNGQFPDVYNQLLEVKLQTAPTIDLGLVLPSSDKLIFSGKNGVSGLAYQDCRYAVFCGDIMGENVFIKKLIVLTGSDFFKRFQRFEGNIVNSKIQLKLPNSFFM